MILMDNAIKYGRARGSVAIRLCTEGPFARIVVTDDGLGIPPEDLPHVFKRFYRVRRGHAAQVSGAGLGLPIAKWLVEAHGGTIEIASKPDKGTTVTVQLPLSSEKA
jgi:signal transduction histidine kinase